MKQYGEKYPQVPEIYINLGDANNANGKLELALDNYQQAILANILDFKNTDLNSFPKKDDFIKHYPLLTALISKAKTLKQLYTKSEGKAIEKP